MQVHHVEFFFWEIRHVGSQGWDFVHRGSLRRGGGEDLKSKKLKFGALFGFFDKKSPILELPFVFFDKNFHFRGSLWFFSPADILGHHPTPTQSYFKHVTSKCLIFVHVSSALFFPFKYSYAPKCTPNFPLQGVKCI